jgi:hypothetical protein
VPMRIVAARNGVFSGQVVVEAGQTQGDERLDGLRAVVTALKQDGATGVIPATAIQLRYAIPNPFWRTALNDLGLPVIWRAKQNAGLFDGTRFDVLLDRVPATANMLAVWVSVRIPADAPPGRYRGNLTLSLPERPQRQCRSS